MTLSQSGKQKTQESIHIPMDASKKSIWAWALYDVGNSAFVTVVLAGFFPLFFKTCWSSGAEVTVSTAKLGFAHTTAGLIIAILAPWWGTVADCGAAKKKFLACCTMLGAAGTALLAVVPCGWWHYAAACSVMGSVGFSASLIFYDSLLPAIAPAREAHRVSSLGFALGYLGGGVMFGLCVFASWQPELFGLSREALIRASFLLTSIWWLGFTMPLILFVPEPVQLPRQRFAQSLKQSIARLRSTLQQARQMKSVWIFLLAYWLYIDGVDTVIRMALDYGMSIGLKQGALISALLLTQFIGFPCAIAFGMLGERWGAKKAVIAGLGIYVIIVMWGMIMRTEREFYVLAAMVGMVQGGVQALSRSIFAGLIPKERAAEFFGFYNMVGKYAVILGPALLGTSAYLTGSPRAGIASLLVFFITGALLLCWVKNDRPSDARHQPPSQTF